MTEPPAPTVIVGHLREREEYDRERDTTSIWLEIDGRDFVGVLNDLLPDRWPDYGRVRITVEFVPDNDVLI